MQSNRQHARHEFNRRLDTRYSGFTCPRPEAADLVFRFNSDRQILMPEDPPVCTGRFVEQRCSCHKRSGAEYFRDRLCDCRKPDQFSHFRDNVCQIAQTVGSAAVGDVLRIVGTAGDVKQCFKAVNGDRIQPVRHDHKSVLVELF